MKQRNLLLLAAAAVILVANAVALTGVAYNRSGVPESRLALTQRELVPPITGGRTAEDSGMSLTLVWRAQPRGTWPESLDGADMRSASPAWLDERRLAALGFDIQRAKGGTDSSDRYISQTQRKVLVVLELAGAAWQQALDEAEQRLARVASLHEAAPQSRDLAQGERHAREALEREQELNSRLFAVDVGTDLEQLRAKYPDRSRYLILPASIRLGFSQRGPQRVLTGYLRQAGARRINVPHSMRGSFPDGIPEPMSRSGHKPSAFTATVAFGRRLEPWIEEITRP